MCCHGNVPSNVESLCGTTRIQTVSATIIYREQKYTAVKAKATEHRQNGCKKTENKTDTRTQLLENDNAQQDVTRKDATRGKRVKWSAIVTGDVTLADWIKQTRSQQPRSDMPRSEQPQSEQIEYEEFVEEYVLSDRETPTNRRVTVFPRPVFPILNAWSTNPIQPLYGLTREDTLL